MKVELLSIVEAAALIQPHLDGVNAANQLADWRRVSASYRRRLATPPPALLR